jgi:hypothetical protein
MNIEPAPEVEKGKGKSKNDTTLHMEGIIASHTSGEYDLSSDDICQQDEKSQTHE